MLELRILGEERIHLALEVALETVHDWSQELDRERLCSRCKRL